MNKPTKARTAAQNLLLIASALLLGACAGEATGPASRPAATDMIQGPNHDSGYTVAERDSVPAIVARVFRVTRAPAP